LNATTRLPVLYGIDTGRNFEPFARTGYLPLESVAPLSSLSVTSILLLESFELLGGGTSVASIVELAPQLERLGREIPLALRCLCAAGTALDALVEELHENDPDSLRLSIEAFSPIALAHALAACDLVLLPGPSRAHLSALLAALHAGRFALSHPDPGYEDLAEFAWTGNDLAEGIRWALTHPLDVLERLHRAKDHVERLHAPASVARHWVRIFQDNVV